jgi:hypothetical protein
MGWRFHFGHGELGVLDSSPLQPVLEVLKVTTVPLRRRTPELEDEPESVIQAQIRKAIGALPHVRLWRNNTGQLKDRFGHTVIYGLAIGSSDLIGIVAPHGRLIAIEVKSKTGKVTPEQEAFMEIVRRFGGVAGVARSFEDAMALVEEARG